MTGKNPETSIIIRTFNEERYLPTLLAAIGEQTYKDWEIIVVDSGSFDQTVQLARKAGVRTIEIRQDDFTFGYSLNVGIQAAGGKLVVIVSAHTHPVDSFWLENLLAPFQDNNVSMVYGRQRGTDISKFSEFQDMRRIFGPVRQEISTKNLFANNANSAIRRALWDQHPFDERLPGLEDIHWAKYWLEKGQKVIYEPEAGIHHIHLETWPQVRHRYFREAIAARTIGIHGIRKAVLAVMSELGRLFQDLALVIRQGEFLSKLGEIARFRLNKGLGIASGLINYQAEVGEEAQNALYFDRRPIAYVITKKHNAAMQEMPLPQVKPSEVLIEVAYEGVCGTDLEIFNHTLGYYRDGMAKYPIIPGHEFSGWITGRGAKVENLKRGDRVVVECIQGCGHCEPCENNNPVSCASRQEMGVIGLNGGYSQFVVARARFVHKIPDELDLKSATLVEPMAVVLKGLRRLHWALEPGQPSDKLPRCAVVGAGPIGHITALVLADRGHEVAIFDRNPKRLELFSSSLIEVSQDLQELQNYPVLIEATGAPEALESMFTHSRPGSTLLLLGLPYSRREFSFESVVAYDMAVVGSVGSSAVEFEEALHLLPNFPCEALTEHIVPFDQAHHVWAHFKEGRHLKTLLKIGG